ncbi:hypothetical protein [Nonomuraea recticatena]
MSARVGTPCTTKESRLMKPIPENRPRSSAIAPKKAPAASVPAAP